MNPGTRSAGPSGKGTGATTAETTPPPSDTIETKRTARRRPPTVYARLLLSPPGATFDRAEVIDCPWCPYPMLHNVPVGSREPIVRSPRCAPHRVYAVVITSVVPAAATTRRQEVA